MNSQLVKVFANTISILIISFQTPAVVLSADLETMAREELTAKTPPHEKPFSEDELLIFAKNQRIFNCALQDDCNRRLSEFDKLKWGRCKDLYMHNSYQLSKAPHGRLYGFLIISEIGSYNENPRNGSLRQIGKYLEKVSSLPAQDANCTQTHVDEFKVLMNKIFDTSMEGRSEEMRLRKQADEELAMCKKRTDYQLFIIEEIIQFHKFSISEAQARMKSEKKASEVSGYINKKLMHESGQTISKSEDALRLNFLEYKKLGGKAKSVEEVVISPDPCKKQQ